MIRNNINARWSGAVRDAGLRPYLCAERGIMTAFRADGTAAFWIRRRAGREWVSAPFGSCNHAAADHCAELLGIEVSHHGQEPERPGI